MSVSRTVNFSEGPRFLKRNPNPLADRVAVIAQRMQNLDVAAGRLQQTLEDLDGGCPAPFGPRDAKAFPRIDSQIQAAHGMHRRLAGIGLLGSVARIAKAQSTLAYRVCAQKQPIDRRARTPAASIEIHTRRKAATVDTRRGLD